jgi:hypothetical protein
MIMATMKPTKMEIVDLDLDPQVAEDTELAMRFLEGLIQDALESAWAEEMFGLN